MTKSASNHAAAIQAIKEDWDESPRWCQVRRDYSAVDVL